MKSIQEVETGNVTMEVQVLSDISNDHSVIDVKVPPKEAAKKHVQIETAKISYKAVDYLNPKALGKSISPSPKITMKQ